MAEKYRVGIVGCGHISGAYIRGCRAFDVLEVAACADVLPERAEAKAREFDIPRATSVEALLADPEIDLVLNLTPPSGHAPVALAAIEAGKHVHGEKPLAVTLEDGRQMVEAAAGCGVRLGCAPDTFLGGGLQTCRKLIDDGGIGEPVAAVAFMASRGPERWHAEPDFFYQTGGGPMLDMGPYYLTALINLLGPVRRVAASTRISFPERVIGSEPRRGQTIKCEVSTHTAGVLDFECGVVATIIQSFDIWASNLPRIEVYGSEGSLSVPDPNLFTGPVRLRRPEADAWAELPLTHADNVGRGIGVADLAHALNHGRPHRASGELALHVLEVMHAFDESSQAGRHIEIASRCERPAPLPLPERGQAARFD